MSFCLVRFVFPVFACLYVVFGWSYVHVCMNAAAAVNWTGLTPPRTNAEPAVTKEVIALEEEEDYDDSGSDSETKEDEVTRKEEDKPLAKEKNIDVETAKTQTDTSEQVMIASVDYYIILFCDISKDFFFWRRRVEVFSHSLFFFCHANRMQSRAVVPAPLTAVTAIAAPVRTVAIRVLVKVVARVTVHQTPKKKK